MPQRDRKRSLEPGREGAREVPTLSGRPRILLAVANPVDLDDYHLSELEGIRDALQEILSRSMDCDPLDDEKPVTLAQLRKKLRSGSYDVLHLVAHGLPPVNGAPGLVLENRKRRAERVQTPVLAAILGRVPHVRLIVLMACFSGAGGCRGLAGQLVRRGIPAVVALSCEGSLAALPVFAEEFYPPLVRSGRVDLALEEALEALLADAATRHDAGSLMGLWPNFPDSQIWHLAPPPAALPTPPTVRPKLRWLRAAALAIPLLLNGPAAPGPAAVPAPELPDGPPEPAAAPPSPSPQETSSGATTSARHRGATFDRAVPEEVCQLIRYARATENSEQKYRLYKGAAEELKRLAPKLYGLDKFRRLQELGAAPLAGDGAYEYARILDPLCQETFNP